VLCWNENPYGASPAAQAAIAQRISQARHPSREADQLVRSIARHEGVDSDHIVLGTGSGELLQSSGVLYGRGGEIIAADPTFSHLPDYARHIGAKVKFIPVDAQLCHDLGAMRAAVSDCTRSIYICNPNNPTGTALRASAIGGFIDSLPDQVMTIVDEAYMDFADGPDICSADTLVASRKAIVVLRTFSKLHGMARARCGYAIARPDIAARIAEARLTNLNILAVRAAKASLADPVFLADCRRRILASRARITTALSRMDLPYARPQGNFVFFDTGAPLGQFTAFMGKRNILVGRRFPPFESWCRIAIGTEPQVDAFLDGLRAFDRQRPRAA
jgi:histidinol-phosphate aminotransferase